MPFQGVSFDDDRQRGSRTSIVERQSVRGMTGWLINHRIVNTEEQAKAVLLIIAVVVFILAGIVFWSNLATDNRPRSTFPLSSPPVGYQPKSGN
jgi:hypothetical protein